MSHNTKFTISTLEREKEIVDMVRKNIEFLKSNRIRFTLPEKAIEKEYNIKKYESYKELLEAEWVKRGEDNFVERLLTFFHKSADFQFIIEISNYGPLGFYNENNNTVTINLNTHLDVIKTIKHEMVHIMVEPFIKKYHIEHKQKESIVNTILKILE